MSIKYKLLSLATVLFLIFLAWKTVGSKSPNLLSTTDPSPSATTLPAPSPISVQINESTYHVYIQEIKNPKELTLLPNFSGQKTTQALVEENHCVYGTNAGFYTKNHEPLGVFITEKGALQTKPHTNALFNGFMYKTKTGKVDIATNQPDEPVDWIFQSGPLFKPGSILKIKDDEPARRILAGKTADDRFYFLALTEENNTNSGPLLSDIPQIFQQFNSQFASLIHNSSFIIIFNLDGGSASAFYKEVGVKLQELIVVGSFLCGK